MGLVCLIAKLKVREALSMKVSLFIIESNFCWRPSSEMLNSVDSKQEVQKVFNHNLCSSAKTKLLLYVPKDDYI